MLDDLLGKIQNAGVIGAGGAGFPSAVKLKSSAEYILVNGAECEPLLQVDQQLSRDKAACLLKTLNTLLKAIGAKEGIFALKSKYKDAISELNKHIKDYPLLRIKELGNYYPMGDEQVLVYEALGRIVPEGGIPLACGVVVINVETLLNIALAIEEEQAVIDKYVTVNGSVKKAATFFVPVGIKYSELIAAAGGSTVNRPVLIDGGPMMGKVQKNLDAPVTKTSKGIIVLNDDHPLVLSKTRRTEEMMRIAKTACCHCMLCTDLCPRYMIGHKLHPDKLMRLASYNSSCEKNETATGAFLCCECGLCEIACIMSLQPWKLNQELKQRMSALGIKNPHKDVPAKANIFREYRQYPIPKLVQKLGLNAYAKLEAPISDFSFQPSEITIMLKQHLGAPSVPVVAEGAEVQRGQLLAAPPEGALGANIHASLSGRIKKIDGLAIIIEVTR